MPPAVTPPRPAARLKALFITSYEDSNTVLVNGPADKVSRARELMTQLDKAERPGQKPPAFGRAVVKNHIVPQGNADAIAKIKRSEFNAGKNAPYVSDEVTLYIPVEAIQK